MLLASSFAVLACLVSLALAGLPAQTPIVAPAPPAPTASVAQYPGITIIPQVAVGPSPWSPPPGYPGATVAGTTVGSNGQTTLSWKDTHLTWINIPSSPPTSPPCGTWTVTSTSATFPNGLILTEPVLTASTIPPVTVVKWSTTKSISVSTTTKTETKTETKAEIETPIKQCIDLQKSWRFLRAGVHQSEITLQDAGFDFDFPQRLTVVNVEYRNTKVDVIVDGKKIGQTSNYKHSVAAEDQCRINIPSDCVDKGHSSGGFWIPQGHHDINLRLDPRSFKDGHTKGLVYKILCKHDW